MRSEEYKEAVLDFPKDAVFAVRSFLRAMCLAGMTYRQTIELLELTKSLVQDFSILPDSIDLELPI